MAWPDTLVSENGPCYTAEVFYKYDERVWCQSHYKLPTLSAIQWIGRKVCPNCQELVLQGKRRGQRSFQMSNDIPQYSLDKQLTTCHANLAKQKCRIRCTYVKCCKKTTWFRFRDNLERSIRLNIYLSHDLHVGQDVMFQYATSKQMVSSYHYKHVFTTKKCNKINYKGRYHLQEDTSTT